MTPWPQVESLSGLWPLRVFSITSEHWPPVPVPYPVSPQPCLAWQVRGREQGGSWTLERAGAPPLQASCCQPSWSDSVETGGPETEINCQVSGAEWGACQPLCFLAWEWGEQEAAPGPVLGCSPCMPSPLTPRCPCPHGSEAGLSLEFDGLVKPGGPVVWD